MQIIFPTLIAFNSFFFSLSTCQSDFTVSTTSLNNSHSIFLTLNRGQLERYSFELYDINSGELVFKSDAEINTNDPVLVFKNIKPSTYTIYFSSVSCPNRRSIKGLGLILE
jgi:hypothetical protein